MTTTLETTVFNLHHSSDDLIVKEGYKVHRVLGFGNIKRITGPDTDLKISRHFTDGSIDKIEGIETGEVVVYKWEYNFLGNLKRILKTKEAA